MKRDTIGCKRDFESAERFWIKDAQTVLVERVAKGEFLKFNPQYLDGVIIVGGCCTRWNEATWNKQEFVLLPLNHRLSYLVAVDNHKKSGHLRVPSTIAIIRSRYWIIKIDKLVGGIINKCIPCRKRRAKFAQQVMNDLPPERLMPSPQFANVGVDYFGPFMMKGEVQKRVRGKGYGVNFTCLVSRAVYQDVAHNYSTDGFLQVVCRDGQDCFIVIMVVT